MKYYVLLFFAISITVFVQAGLKMLSMKYDGKIISAVQDPLLFVISFSLLLAFAAWFVAASQINLNVLIPANVLTIVLSAVIGYFFFAEPITIDKIIAYVLILSGVSVLLYYDLSTV